MSTTVAVGMCPWIDSKIPDDNRAWRPYSCPAISREGIGGAPIPFFASAVREWSVALVDPHWPWA